MKKYCLALYLVCCSQFTIGRAEFITCGASDDVEIYVVKPSFIHTALIVPNEGLVVSDKLSNADYLELGWGDRAFYQASVKGFGAMAATAPYSLFASNPSVMEIKKLKTTGRCHNCLGLNYYLGLFTYVSVKVSRDDWEHIVDSINASFAPGLTLETFEGYPFSQFAASSAPYRGVNKTCNTWVTETLSQTQYKVDSTYFAEDVMNRLSELSKENPDCVQIFNNESN